MLKIAHRGASGYVAENTIASFEKAIELKADMIELDIHDDHGSLRVSHKKPKREKVPLLTEVISFVRGKIQLNIEIKEGGQIYPGIEEKLVSLLRKENFADQCIISSFDARTVQRAKRLNPSVLCGLIFDRRAFSNLQLAVDIGMDVVHPRWTICTPELIQQAHQKKMKIFVWTVNTPGQVEYFRGLQVDGVISDYPDIL